MAAVVGKVFEYFDIPAQSAVRLKFDQDPTGSFPSGVTAPYFGFNPSDAMGMEMARTFRLAMDNGWAVSVYGAGVALAGTSYEAIQSFALYPN